MPVFGSDDGIKNSNKGSKRVAPLMSVDELKRTYLFGIDIVDNNGNELSQEAYQDYLDNAVSMLEHELDISITPRKEVEDRDYHMNEYWDWGYFQLNNFPVIQVDKMELIYFRDENGEAETLQEIPNNWIRIQPHDGILRLIPNARFPANLQVDQVGNYFPEILRTRMVPHLWRITYTHGFKDGCVPVLINQAIGYLAAIQALIIAGNLVIGAGISAQSISLDGLSQSITTTASAENSSYSATIKEYQRLMFGANKDDPSAIIKRLKDYYKGQTMGII